MCELLEIKMLTTLSWQPASPSLPEQRRRYISRQQQVIELFFSSTAFSVSAQYSRQSTADYAGGKDCSDRHSI